MTNKSKFIYIDNKYRKGYGAFWYFENSKIYTYHVDLWYWTERTSSGEKYSLCKAVKFLYNIMTNEESKKNNPVYFNGVKASL